MDIKFSDVFKNYFFNGVAVREISAVIIQIACFLVFNSITGYVKLAVSDPSQNAVLLMGLSIYAATALLTFTYISLRSLLPALVLLILSVALQLSGFPFESKVTLAAFMLSVVFFTSRTFDHYVESKLQADIQP